MTAISRRNFLKAAGITAAAAALPLTLTGCGDKKGFNIAVPNDTTNEARSLLLLQSLGILTLKEGAGITATKNDIVENPEVGTLLEDITDIVTQSIRNLIALLFVSEKIDSLVCLCARRLLLSCLTLSQSLTKELTKNLDSLLVILSRLLSHTFSQTTLYRLSI